MKSDIIFYKLRSDIVGTDGVTTSYDGKSRYNDIEAARSAATRARQSLFEKYFNGEIRDYKVDVIPDNE